MSETPNAELPEGRRRDFVSLLSVLQSLLAGGGLILYGALNLAYARFYDRLGLSPNDVGLGYASTLIRSSGLLILVVIPLVLTAGLFVMRRRPRTRKSSAASPFIVSARHEGLEARKRWPRFTALRPIAVWLLGLALGVFTALILPVIATQIARLPEAVSSRVEAVKQGREVSPLRWGPLTILDVSATEAQLQWINKPSGSPDLSTHHLLYLGQADGQLVFYDSGTHQNVVKLPSNSVALTLNNCPTDRQDDGTCL
jgi:hypothetical protein